MIVYKVFLVESDGLYSIHKAWLPNSDLAIEYCPNTRNVGVYDTPLFVFNSIEAAKQFCDEQISTLQRKAAIEIWECETEDVRRICWITPVRSLNVARIKSWWGSFQVGVLDAPTGTMICNSVMPIRAILRWEVTR